MSAGRLSDKMEDTIIAIVLLIMEKGIVLEIDSEYLK